MAYGLKYILNYDGGPAGNEPYTLEFYFENYTGTFYNMIGVQAAVEHSWDKDEPKPGVKGSSIDISLLNKNGSLPLSNFFSVTDDNCKVVHKWHDQVLFSGFLVQDDCSELMVDYSHQISLKATDNLGLLKDVALDKANLIVGDGNRVITGIQAYSVPPAPPAAGYLFINSTTTGAVIGDTIIIDGTTGSDGVYIIKNIVPLGAPGTAFYLDRDFPFAIINSTSYTFTFITPADLGDRLSLAYIIRICLYNTNVILNTDVYSNIIETVTATPRFLEETFISGNDFSNSNDDFKSCYDVLTIIMERFNATLFQAEGVWNIIRRDEHRYYDNLITGFRYSSSMVYVEDIEFSDIFTAEPNINPAVAAPLTYPLSGITKSILRPYNFDKETFNYRQVNLLRNADLQSLGRLLNTYTSGSNTVKEYEFLFWDVPAGYPPTNGGYFIRITTDSVGNEISRYVVIKEGVGNVGWPLSLQSTGIEVNKGDVIEFSFSVRTNTSNPTTTAGIRTAIQLFDGADKYYPTNFYIVLPDPVVFVPADWQILTYPFPALSGFWFTQWTGNTNEWLSVKIITSSTPVSGILRCMLPTERDETWIKDLTLKIIPSVSDSLKIIGHTHTDTQQQPIKNNEDVEIYIDDSPRNSIAGTMLLSTFTGLLQDRTTLWGYAPGGTRRLGEITTFEQLFWRRVPRTKMEGTMYGLIQPTNKRFAVLMDWQNVDLPPLAAGVILPPEIVALLTVGDTFIVTGTASNNGTFTVVSIDPPFSAPGFVEVAETVVLEVVNGYITLLNIPRHISMLTLLKYTGLPGLNFIFGRLSIDHKYNKFNGTFWEQWADGEVDEDLISDYNFKYLYETK